jgi:hypothetical protein
MSINTLSAPTADIGQLVQRLVATADLNKDGSVSSSEFGSFLTGLIGGISSRDDLKGTRLSALTSDAAPSTAPFNEVPGFVLSKLQDSTHVTPKYSAAVRAFSQAIAGLSPVPASLPTIVSFAQANGFPDAKITKSDSIDFGDGRGPIDLIVDVDGPLSSWSFQNA